MYGFRGGGCISIPHLVIKTNFEKIKLEIMEIIRGKKNYGNSNISPCKNIIFKKRKKFL
jgi:hypothetical protein